MSNSDLELASFDDADLTNAILQGAFVTGASFKDVILTGSDWTDVILRKDTYQMLCTNPTAKGTNPVTGADTRESLNCPPL